jgi:anti-anti-sigma regulatory factor
MEGVTAGLIHDAVTGRLIGSGELTIYQAEASKASLVAALAAGGDLELDLREVTELDTAGLQLLILLRDTVAQRDSGLHVTGISDAAAAVLALAGIELGTASADAAEETPA